MSIDHRLDIYGTELHLVTTAAGVRGIRKRYPDMGTGFDGEANGQTCHMVDEQSPTNQFHVFLYLNMAALIENGDEAYAIGVVAHEATHVAGAICNHKGVEQDGWLEHYAYLVGWLTSWIWKEAIR